MIHESTILAFVGLTLVFWGCLFLFVLPRKHVKSEVMDCMANSVLDALNQLIADSNVEGKPVYIPVPKGAFLPYHLALRNEFVYIPRKNVRVETAIEHAFMKNPKGLRVTPPGLGLVNHMEEKAKLDFHRLEVGSLEETVSYVLVNELGIASGFKTRLEEKAVYSEIVDPVCEDLCGEAKKMRYICSNVGCPLCSSIACILTRVLNKPVVIESCLVKGNTIGTSFRIV